MDEVLGEIISQRCPLERKSGVYTGQAAVLILLVPSEGATEGGLEIVLTQRAEHLRTHAGEVAFPGGMWELGDADLAATALRESWEEVGVSPEQVELLGSLPACETRQGIRVTPYIAHIQSVGILSANRDELDSLFTVPLAYLLGDPRIRTDVFSRQGRKWHVPVYEYRSDGCSCGQIYTIWGFTAAVLVDFLNVGLRAEINLRPWQV